jgi:hypothetical protein
MIRVPILRRRGAAADVAWPKIESNPKSPEYILTVHGLGYGFVG